MEKVYTQEESIKKYVNILLILDLQIANFLTLQMFNGKNPLDITRIKDKYTCLDAILETIKNELTWQQADYLEKEVSGSMGQIEDYLQLLKDHKKRVVVSEAEEKSIRDYNQKLLEHLKFFASYRCSVMKIAAS